MSKEYVIKSKEDDCYFGGERKLLFTDKVLEEGVYSYVKVNKLPIPETIKGVNSKNEELTVLGVTAGGLVVFDNDVKCESYKGITVTFQEAELPLKEEIFNTQEGLSDYICDLKSLNEIIEARTIYGKIYGVRMENFVFNKIVLLDRFGQSFVFNEVSFGNDDVYRLGKVVNLQELIRYEMHYSYGEKYVPSIDEKCEQCGEAFTVDDLSSISSTWHSRKMMHNGCIGHHYYETERETIEEMMKKVYQHELSYRGIKSNYNIDKNGHNRPWFKIGTPDGDILIGKRKRVFHIEWHESYKSFSETFSSEDVTKEFSAHKNERYIHAYSVEDAVKYLTLAKNSI